MSVTISNAINICKCGLAEGVYHPKYNPEFERYCFIGVTGRGTFMSEGTGVINPSFYSPEAFWGTRNWELYGGLYGTGY